MAGRPSTCSRIVPDGFTEARAERDKLESETKRLGDQLRAFPRGATGLTPDSVKFTPEYQTVSQQAANAFKRLQAFNACFTKRFFKELREERKRR